MALCFAALVYFDRAFATLSLTDTPSLNRCQNFAEAFFMIYKRRQRNSVISVRVVLLLLIVLVLGVVLKIDLWTQPIVSSSMMSSTVSLSATSTEKKPGDRRAPSSIGVPEFTASPSEVTERLSDTTLEWDCSTEKKSIRLSNINSLRLDGKCLKNIRRIVNNTNGYTASIFRWGDGATTDYLSLDSGTNYLQMEWNDVATGKSPEFFEIIVEKQ